MIRKLGVCSVVVLFALGYTACKNAELVVEPSRSEEQKEVVSSDDARVP